MTPSPHPVSTSAFHTDRVSAIDGLRGIAAMLVVLYHLEEAVSRTATDWLWDPIRAVVRQGYLGVDVFFVISGFVIALSVSRFETTPSFLGRFALRRSIRLDPPYWAAILMELLLLAATRYIAPERFVGYPSGSALLAHLVYLQEILGFGSLIEIFWTLSYEIQFYLFFVSLGVLGWLMPGVRRRPVLVATVAALLFLLSVYTRYAPPDWLPHGVALDRWFQFFTGVLTWRAVVDRRKSGTLFAAWAIVMLAVVLTGRPLSQFVTVAVSATVLLAVHRPSVGRVLQWRPLLALGTISYSLYLLHSSVGWRFVSFLQLIAPGPWNALTAVLVFSVAVLTCVGVAAVAWWAIERPSLALARRIPLVKQRPHAESART